MPRAAVILVSLLASLSFAPLSVAKHGDDREPRVDRERDSGRSDRSGSSHQDRDTEPAREIRTRDSGSENSGHGSQDSGSSSGSGGGDSENSGHGSVSSGDDGSETDGESESAEGNQGTSKSGKTRVARDERGDEYVDREVLLTVPGRAALQSIERDGYMVLSQDELPAAGIVLVRLRAPASGDISLDALQRAFPGSSVSLNSVYRANRGAPDVANAAPLPARAAGSAAVGLIDARVDAAHPMLHNVKVVAAHFEDGVPAATDHGTALASVFAARQEHVELYSASVFTGTGDDGFGASAASIARALDWLSGQGVQAINVSLSGPPNPILERVVARLFARGLVVVAAVGNDGPSRNIRYPAAYRDAVAVTAVDRAHTVYRYANRGPEVDFSAVGVGLRVAAQGGGFQTVSGTSFAAPIVALELARAARDLGGAGRARDALQRAAADLGAPGPDPVFGWGLVGERQSLDAVARSR